jgi:hypothetical protein
MSALTDPNDLGQLSAEFAAQTAAAAAKQPLTGNTFTVATVPAAAANVGRVIYVSNGAAGAATAAISDGTNWKRIAIGVNIAAE